MVAATACRLPKHSRTPAIASSNDGQTYTQGSAATVAYTCTDSGGSGLASCVGDVTNGAALDTAAVGSHSYTVNATDQVGNHSAKTVSYIVTVRPANQPGGGGGGGDKTPPTVTLAGLPASQALSGGALGFSLKCSENCNWSVDGTVNVPGAARAFKLKRKSGSAKAGATVKLTLKLDRKTQAAVRKALAKGIKVTARVNLQVTDGAGNTRLVTRTIRIKKR